MNGGLASLPTPEIVVVGSLNVDFVTGVDRLPGPGETVLGDRFAMVPGGKGANQAVTAARLGARVAMLGCIGTDPLGDVLVETLRSEGLDPDLLTRVEEVGTGVAQIAVDSDGANAITVVPRANLSLRPAHINAHRDLLVNARVVLCQLEIPIETVQAALRIGRSSGVTTILNPAPAQLLDPGLLALVDICVPNEHELALLTGCAGTRDGARTLLAMGCGAVVVTLGANGALLVRADGEVHVPAFAVDVVDTVAAGDAFCGGLAAALARAAPIEEALRMASAAGGLAATTRGAITSLPRASDVDALLAKASRS